MITLFHFLRRTLWASVLLLALFAVPGQAKIDLPSQTGASSASGKSAVKVEFVEAQLVSNYNGRPPAGEVLKLGLLLKHDPHWHTYWRNPGDSGLPTQIDLTLPTAWKAGQIEWPAPIRIPVGPLVNYGFEGTVLLPIKIQPAAGSSDEIVSFSAKVQWLMCKDVCIPGEAELSYAIPWKEGQGAATPFKAMFDEAAKRNPKQVSASHSAKAGGLALSLVLDSLQTTPLAAIAPGSLAAENASFFPYVSEIIKPASPQRVFLSEPEPKSEARTVRFELSAVDGAATPTQLEGLLVLNGSLLEVKSALSQTSAAEGGRLLTDGVLSVKPLSASVAVASRAQPQDIQSFVLSIVSALIGGLILNLMPCVFPVLGLKALGFASQAGVDKRHRIKSALLFSLGVIGSFLTLAFLMTLLQQGGEAVGWGFQLQSPWFVVTMAWLFTLIGLNLCGLFEIGLALTRVSSLGTPSTPSTASASVWSEFGSGVLAVLVATPCTAPFMGAALGATLSQGPLEKFAVFAALGVGMALPYVLLTLLPRLSRWLPRPGAWMETFKQILAFPMFATVAWLVWVLGQQLDLDAVFSTLLSIVVLGLAAWLYGRWQRQSLVSGTSSVKTWALLLSTALALAGAVALVQVSPSSSSASAKAVWEPWSPNAVRNALAQKRPVFVDFTAAWCVSCQVNKKAVLETEASQKFFADKNVLLLKADWTKRDPEITAELARYGRNGVPLYQVWLPSSGQGASASPQLLPELLTRNIVEAAFKR
jgi:thiol:disulfide interchange protein